MKEVISHNLEGYRWSSELRGWTEHLLSCGAVVEEEVIVLIVELSGERGHSHGADGGQNSLNVVAFLMRKKVRVDGEEGLYRS